MRRIVTQAAAGQARKTVTPSSALSRSTTSRSSAPRQPPLRDAYVALSDFFRSNLLRTESQLVKPGTPRQLALRGSAVSHYQDRTSSLRIRTFSSTSRWSLQQPSSSAEEQSSKQNTADHSAKSHDEHRIADESTSQTQKTTSRPSSTPTPAPDVLDHVSSFPRSLRQLAMSLPTASLRRPTKDE